MEASRKLSHWNKQRGSRITKTTKTYQEVLNQSILGTSRKNEALHAVVENKLNNAALGEKDNSVLERNRALLQYVATLADSNRRSDEFNYEFVLSLIKGGADINISDQHGQSLFHEVARSWSTEVAQFLLDLGGDIERTDNYGRTPLHVAASVDYKEMTEFLLKKNANMDARTLGELQAPIHYAAKNGAINSLKVLIGYKADIDSVDHRRRTPLQLAGQWSRDKTAKLLIDEGASSWILDSFGNSALSVLIDRLSNLALQALDQLHARDSITMTDSYHLNHLETSKLQAETKRIRTPLEVAVALRKYEVVTHPVMQRLIQNKWKKFARLSTALDLFFYIVFNIMWTAMSVLTPETGRELYEPLNEKSWRILLLIVIGIMIIYQVVHQFTVTRKTIRAQKYWIEWKTNELQDDLKYCHPRWPQEEKAVRYEIKRTSKLQTFSGNDAWFYYDWFVLVVMLAAIVAHIIYYKVNTNTARDVYTKIASVVNLVVSLRLLENIRPFPGIGTLVIILGETAGDFVNWGFLFILLYIPFTSAFWVIFGGVSLTPVEGYRRTRDVLYSTFRMAVGDDFNMEGLIEAEPVMSRLLTAVYVTAMTICTLNLLIALLSDTFTRVHNNAVANMIMQRAIKVINAEQTLSKKKRQIYRDHMRTNCSPEIIHMVIDGSSIRNDKAESVELQRDLENVKQILDDRFGTVFGKNKASDFDKIKQNLKELELQQRFLHEDLETTLNLLHKIRGKTKHSKHIQLDGEKSRDDLQIKIPGLDSLKTRLSSLFDSSAKKPIEERQKEKKKARSRKHRRRDSRGRTASIEDHHTPGTSRSIVPYNPNVASVNTGFSNAGFDRGNSTLDNTSVHSLDL